MRRLNVAVDHNRSPSIAAVVAVGLRGLLWTLRTMWALWTPERVALCDRLKEFDVALGLLGGADAGAVDPRDLFAEG